jgi:two-component system sensor histidine kinase AlgZ
MAIGALFGVSSAFDWVLRLAILTGAALPGTLAWLVVACISKKLLAAA